MSTAEKIHCITPDHPDLSIRQQCELLDCTRSVFYYKPVGTSPFNLELMALIDKIFTEQPAYGIRRITEELRGMNYQVNRKRVRRLMRLMGLIPIYPKPNLSIRNKEHKVYPYLLRDVEITQVNQVWSTDITYIPMKNGFMYLTVVIDWYSRKILSWRLSNTLTADFCIDALKEAIQKFGVCEIFNTDQGSQYTSDGFIKVLQDHNIAISMDSKGRALDNIFVERFWRTVKYENIYIYKYETVKDLYAGLKDFMVFYNTRRRHQSLEYQTPDQFYQNALCCKKVA